jgi:hypothetical protein
MDPPVLLAAAKAKDPRSRLIRDVRGFYLKHGSFPTIGELISAMEAKIKTDRELVGMYDEHIGRLLAQRDQAAHEASRERAKSTSRSSAISSRRASTPSPPSSRRETSART